MDPNANLKEQRKMAKLLLAEPADLEGGYSDEEANNRDNAARSLAELVEALDQWIVKGGFLPTEWTTKRASGLALGIRPSPKDIEESKR